ncbi:hypothetical protein AB0L00_10370 [Actinoallomurus sp. NPDC052308]|uniref:hypothetical protein n=1 Tax=Actinoallomurus sp. NPDC052308 TaxID=3155530 RepID=UPI0034330BEA
MSSQGLKINQQSYQAAAALLAGAAETIYQTGYKLSQVWKGDSAAKMQEKLKELWEQARELTTAASMLENNLFNNQAQTIADYAENTKNRPTKDDAHWYNPGTDWYSPSEFSILGAFNDSKDEIDKRNKDRAQRYMNVGYLENGNDSLGKLTMFDNGGVPETMKVNNPTVTPLDTPPLDNQHPIPSGATPGHPGGPGGKIPNPGAGIHPGTGGGVPNPGGGIHPGTGGGTHPGTGGGTHPGTGGNVPHVGSGGGGDLAGLHQGNPGGLGDGLGHGGGGLGNPGGGLGHGLGGSGGGLGNGLGGGVGGFGGSRGLGTAGGRSSGGAAGGLAAEEEAAAARMAGAKGANGASGVPMGGMGAGSGQEQERERSTWLTEDEDVWGGDGDVAPPVIG